MNARRARARGATGDEAEATGGRSSRRRFSALVQATAGAILIAASATAQPPPAQPPPPPQQQQPAAGGDDGQPQEVVHNENGFTIHAVNADLPRLLTAVGNQVGFSVVDSGHTHQPLNVWITDAPLDVTLRRLLREANYILVYREGKRSTEISDDGIDQVILLSTAGQGAAPPGNASPLAGPQAGGHPPPPGALPPGAPPPGVAPAPGLGPIPPGVPGALPPAAVAGAAPGGPGQSQMPMPRRLRANQAQAQIQPGDLEALGLDPNMAAAGAVAGAGGRGMFAPPGANIQMPTPDDADSGDEE